MTTKKLVVNEPFLFIRKQLFNSNCVFFYWIFAWKCFKPLNTSSITFCLFIFFIANSNLFFSLFAPSIAVTIDLNSLKNPKFEKNSLSSVSVSVQTKSRSMIGSQLEVACLSNVWLDNTFRVLWVQKLFEKCLLSCPENCSPSLEIGSGEVSWSCLGNVSSNQITVKSATSGRQPNILREIGWTETKTELRLFFWNRGSVVTLTQLLLVWMVEKDGRKSIFCLLHWIHVNQESFRKHNTRLCEQFQKSQFFTTYNYKNSFASHFVIFIPSLLNFDAKYSLEVQKKAWQTIFLS